jgi:hypothetical protein
MIQVRRVASTVGNHAALIERKAFAAYLAPLRR